MTREERIRFRKQEDLRQIIQSEHGKRFLYRLLEETGFRSDVFTNNGWTAYHAGKKSVGDKLFDDLLELGREYMVAVLYAAEDDLLLQDELKGDEDV